MSVVRYNGVVFGKPIVLQSNDNDKYLIDLINNSSTPEDDILKVINSSTQKDSQIVDIGANIGYTSVIMAILAPKGKVFSFEPAPKTFAFLEKNIKANGLSNISAYNIGLSDKKVKAKISYRSDFPAGAFVSDKFSVNKLDRITEESINLDTLDRIYKKIGITQCDLLKIDVEGHELSSLKGARKFIKEFQPLTIMEANHWCLNIFNRISLPEFIDSVYKYFPYIYAFDGGKIIDLNDEKSRFDFYHENTVNNKYQDIICGFNKKMILKILRDAFRPSPSTLQSQADELSIKHQNLVSSRPQKIARFANKFLKQ